MTIRVPLTGKIEKAERPKRPSAKEFLGVVPKESSPPPEPQRLAEATNPWIERLESATREIQTIIDEMKGKKS